MRIHPHAKKRLDRRAPPARPARARTARAAAAILLLGATALLSGCGASTLSVTLRATPDCNSCGKPAGYPLTYRVLQVTDPSVVTGMSLTQLWGKEAALLGPALLDTKESFIDPGQKKSLPVAKKPGATALVIVGNYCKPRGTCWYYAQPLSKGKKVQLQAGADCLSVKK